MKSIAPSRMFVMHPEAGIRGDFRSVSIALAVRFFPIVMHAVQVYPGWLITKPHATTNVAHVSVYEPRFLVQPYSVPFDAQTRLSHVTARYLGKQQFRLV